MPSRNIIKVFDTHSYYHAYNRGVGEQLVFIEPADKRRFLTIIARHLDPDNPSTKNDGALYRKFDKEIELLCYCLMGSHFHMLFYLADDPKAISDFMRSVLTAYTMYFNKKYKRKGPLFQSVYKSSRITNDSYLLHISRYIHLNARTYKTYRFSSIAVYLGQPAEEWFKPQKILDLFDGADYLEFLEDYENQQEYLEKIKHELADSV